MGNYDKFTSIIWLIVGLVFFIGGVNLGIEKISSPGPGFFPSLFSAILILLSLILFFLNLKEKKNFTEKKLWKDKNSWRPVCLTLFSLVLYALLLNYIGYITTTFILLFYLVKIIGEKGLMQAFILSLLGTSISYCVFKVLFEVPLPKGIFGL
jgi:putative tricarboxylic transport membrane protein